MFLVEWLLKGREVGCLPKDAEKPARGGIGGLVGRISLRPPLCGAGPNYRFIIVLYDKIIIEYGESRGARAQKMH